MATHDYTYINPLTDFGFKRLFGTEKNKALLIDFINALLFEDKSKIKDLTFNNNELIGNNLLDRNIVVDLTCTNENGEQFIIEMQKAHQLYFIDRSLFYSARAIVNQPPKGNWDFNLKAIYTIGIVDFIIDETSPNAIITGKITNLGNGSILYDKLTLTYIQLPLFKKEFSSCHSQIEKWIYLFRNLPQMDSMPKEVKDDKIFSQFNEEAKIANLSKEESDRYVRDAYRASDLDNVINSAISKGVAEGLAQGLAEGELKGKLEGKLETAKALLSMGLSISDIIKATGLSKKDLENL